MDNITKDNTIEMVKLEVRNWFNKDNNPNEPAIDSMEYKRFKWLCEEIHAFVQSPAGKASPYTSESVFTSFSKTRATKADGTPVGWQEVFAKRLNPFRRMFENTGR